MILAQNGFCLRQSLRVTSIKALIWGKGEFRMEQKRYDRFSPRILTRSLAVLLTALCLVSQPWSTIQVTASQAGSALSSAAAALQETGARQKAGITLGVKKKILYLGPGRCHFPHDRSSHLPAGFALHYG